jgi:hypothetical protein
MGVVPIASAQSVPRDTPVALMVMREVSARTAKPGMRFPLETMEPIIVDGTIVVPVGAMAWGEVIDAEPAGTGGRGGRVSARLLYVEAGGRRLSLEGRASTDVRRSSRDVTALSASIGPFALLARGHDARIKAGQYVTGIVSGEPVPRAGPVLHANTLVTLETLSVLSSETVARGDRIALAVVDDVRMGDVIAVPAGSRAYGEIVAADRKGAFGVGGRLAVALLYIELGAQIVRIEGQAERDGRNGPVRGLSSSALVPALTVGLTGRRAEIPVRTRIEARVLYDTDLPVR